MIFLLVHLHRSSSFSIRFMSVRFLKMYHINHVIVNTGIASMPGISSRSEMNPIQPKNATDRTVPAKSRGSPMTGAIRGGKRYSMKSRSRQTNKVAISFPQSLTSHGKDRDFVYKMSIHKFYKGRYKKTVFYLQGCEGSGTMNSPVSPVTIMNDPPPVCAISLRVSRYM